jgi:hypothetical protein
MQFADLIIEPFVVAPSAVILAKMTPALSPEPSSQRIKPQKQHKTQISEKRRDTREALWHTLQIRG